MSNDVKAKVQQVLEALRRRVNPEWAEQITNLHGIYQVAAVVNAHSCCGGVRYAATALLQGHTTWFIERYVQGDKSEFARQLSWYVDQISAIEDEEAAEEDLREGQGRKELEGFLSRFGVRS